MREIKKIILHCSATKEGQHFTVADIDLWHKQRGFSQIGYHKVIYLDGSTHNGRPLDQVGAHCIGHNEDSIGICYIGGLDSSGNPKDTRTLKQKAALLEEINELKMLFPQATIHGHNEFAAKACPCFNVQTEL